MVVSEKRCFLRRKLIFLGKDLFSQRKHGVLRGSVLSQKILSLLAGKGDAEQEWFVGVGDSHVCKNECN